MLVLVVDNNPVVLKLMQGLLERHGHSVLTAKDGLSALEILKSRVPDVIFTDLVMPNIDGKKLCQIVRNMPGLEDVYIVVLSAVASEELSTCADMHADICIAKGPFNDMARNVLYVLKQCEKGRVENKSEKVIGVSAIRPRTITQELLSAKRHLEVVLEKMSEGIIELTSNRKVVYINPAAVAILGEPEEHILSEDILKFFGNGDRKRLLELLRHAPDVPSRIGDDDPIKVRGKQLTITLLPLKEEESQTFILIINDITSQKEMEAKIRQSEKMEALGTLAGGVAHDFNNLLMGILGNISLLLLEFSSGSTVYKKLKDIEEYVQSASSLTKQLLGFAREGKYEVIPCNLNEVVQKTSEMFGRTKKDVRIHIRLHSDLWTTEADRSQLRQVVLNLLVNAGQAMPEGGDIYIKTENVTLSQEAARKAGVRQGKYVVLCVRDTGVGIDKKVRERLFEPFFTTKEPGKGTGLGLASVYGIIKNHGGFIEVLSEKGKGATFNLYLLAVKSALSVPATENDTVQFSKGGETILIVDDEDVVTNVTKPMLEALGYKVLVAKSGKEAVRICKYNRDEIALVILDMIMPGMSGRETLERLKRVAPTVRVLLSSGYRADGEIQQMLDQGCEGFIQKPFTLQRLSEKVREILGGRGDRFADKRSKLDVVNYHPCGALESESCGIRESISG